jgi:hypothetical protein
VAAWEKFQSNSPPRTFRVRAGFPLTPCFSKVGRPPLELRQLLQQFSFSNLKSGCSVLAHGIFAELGQAEFSQKNVHSSPLVSIPVHSCHIHVGSNAVAAKTHGMIGA